jgi:hypothetical protein
MIVGVFCDERSVNWEHTSEQSFLFSKLFSSDDRRYSDSYQHHQVTIHPLQTEDVLCALAPTDLTVTVSVDRMGEPPIKGESQVSVGHKGAMLRPGSLITCGLAKMQLLCHYKPHGLSQAGA